MNEWIEIEGINGTLPKEGQTVWACNKNTGFITLACLIYDEGLLWAVFDGHIYSEKRNIIADCILDDNYDFTHWIALPKLPQ